MPGGPLARRAMKDEKVTQLLGCLGVFCMVVGLVVILEKGQEIWEGLKVQSGLFDVLSPLLVIAITFVLYRVLSK
jgi:hypothetical protein